MNITAIGLVTDHKHLDTGRVYPRPLVEQALRQITFPLYGGLLPNEDEKVVVWSEAVLNDDGEVILRGQVVEEVLQNGIGVALRGIGTVNNNGIVTELIIEGFDFTMTPSNPACVVLSLE